jgi:hypothetical protein
MLVLIVVLLALIPAVAILYPFLRRPGQVLPLEEDESSAYAELSRRWEAVVAGLKNTELEHAIGNLADEDYRWLTEQYTADAAVVMKALDLEEHQEREFQSALEAEVLNARRVVGATDGVRPPEEPARE